MDNHECKKEEIIDCIKDDLKDIKKDLQELIKFKTQAMLIITAISGGIAFIINIIIK